MSTVVARVAVPIVPTIGCANVAVPLIVITSPELSPRFTSPAKVEIPLTNTLPVNSACCVVSLFAPGL